MHRCALVLLGLLAACGAVERSDRKPQDATRLYLVRIGDRYGYVDRDGNPKIAAQFERAGAFHDGRAKIAVGGLQPDGVYNHSLSREGFINEVGRVVIEPVYESVRQFSEGLAAVRVDRKWGYIDVSGKMVIEPTLRGRVGEFSNGRAYVELSRSSLGYLDPTGKFAFQVEGCDVSGPGNFREGLVRVEMKDGRYRFYDVDGNIALDLDVEFAGPFSDGLSRCRTEDGWGYIDKRGEFVIEPQYDFAGWFVAPFGIVTKDKQSMYVGRDGKVPFDCSPYEDLSGFHEGLARVRSKETGRYGWIDTTGKLVIPAVWDDPMSAAGHFRNGRALVVDKQRGKRWQGYIDTTGTLVWSTPKN